MSNLSPGEANRLFYKTHARHYDTVEYCAHAPEAQERLANAIGPALAALGPDARVLDAGGGSGNVSSLLADRGFRPRLVDVSAEMVARWEAKARARGLEPDTEVAPLEEFFERDQDCWDLIVFSSVLHHLEQPISLLEMAVRRLQPGGFLVTVFDPLQLGRVGTLLRKLDYLLWVVRHSPQRIPGVVARRLRPGATGGGEDNLGAIAEYHAVRGLDDWAIIEALGAGGMDLVAHGRTYDARFGIVRAISSAMRTPTSFSLVMRRRAARRARTRSKPEARREASARARSGNGPWRG